MSYSHYISLLNHAVSYFKNNWVKRADVRNWWQGASPCMPITNNGLERANAILKGESGTQGDKLGLQELLDQVMFFSFTFSPKIVRIRKFCLLNRTKYSAIRNEK